MLFHWNIEMLAIQGLRGTGGKRFLRIAQSQHMFGIDAMTKLIL